jgi:(p)ppGpp synthase/HD superfamily hydrolase
MGLSVASARLDDLSFEILFGDAYSNMREWMRSEQSRWVTVLGCMKEQVQAALDADTRLRRLGASATVTTRAKSSYSLMKKLLTLSGTPPLQLLHIPACCMLLALHEESCCVEGVTAVVAHA